MLCLQGTIDEYIELYLQFGYVCLFSSLLPWAAVCAFVNNVIELKSDAFKLCRLHQRPFGKISSGIGAWKVSSEAPSQPLSSNKNSEVERIPESN